MWTVWVLWTVGVAWRWWAGVYGTEWKIGLPASAILEFAAFVLAQYVLWFDRDPKPANLLEADTKKSFPGDLASWLGVAGFAIFGTALILNLGICFEVAWHGAAPIYPPVADRIFLILALWGFVIPVAWGYSTRFVTVFAGLAKPVQSAARWLAAGVVAIAICALAQQFAAADILALAVAAFAVWALRVFLPSVQEPKRAGVYAHFPAFIRVAYGWLLAGAALGVCADFAPQLTGLGGASRHALTVGFIAMLIFCVGPLILPSFMNGRQLFSTKLMSASLWMLALGCLLRVSSEAVAYSNGGIGWNILPISAFIELAAVLLFVANLGLTLVQPMPAWFSSAGVSSRMPVYFYITSFPKTRRVLIESGLATLGRIKEVPRTLTLEQAAAADGADVERLLEALRKFFARRQPRR